MPSRPSAPSAAIALVALALSACAPLRGRHADADEGRDRYRRACASCHGVTGHGDGPVASSLRTPPPDLTTVSARHGGTFPRTLVVAMITGDYPVDAHGTRDMPVWSERFPDGSGATAAASFYARRRTELIADYIASLQEPSR
jgi:mono/diheme cytochrome c family protein